LVAKLPTSPPNLPLKTNQLAQASAVKVALVKAATEITVAAVNAVAKHAEVAAKAAPVKAVMTAATKPRPMPHAATALKVDADVDEAIDQTDAVAKRLGPQKPAPTPWLAM
jgi:hypothetical protein